MEIAIALAIFGGAGYFLYKSIKKKSSGGCDCGGCSTRCSAYKKPDEK